MCLFLSVFQLYTLSSSPSDLVLFLELMATTVTYAHLKRLLCSMKFYHKAQNLMFPEFDFDIVNTLQRIKRRNSTHPTKPYHRRHEVRALWWRRGPYGALTWSRKTLLRRHIRVSCDTDPVMDPGHHLIALCGVPDLFSGRMVGGIKNKAKSAQLSWNWGWA